MNKNYICPNCKGKISYRTKYYICTKCEDIFPIYLKYPVFLTKKGDFYNLKKILIKDIFKDGNKFT